jgi:hypothetical protein
LALLEVGVAGSLGFFPDGDGYRIGCVTGAADISGLTTWDVTDVTEAEALAHCQAVDSRTFLKDDGLFDSCDEPEHVE